ncbi:MAG TPA: class I SAM-dependent methyltransferase, partial [Verrucomicrobiae bacterium]|nr:class I SAM-dependent methyltransferase [Verrucomicrobiae bacterium]
MIDANPETGSNKGYEKRQLKTIAARWDAKAADWDHNLEDPLCHLNEDHAYRRFLDEARKVIHERRDFCSRNGLIDCACATGLVLQELISDFAWAVGVDISPQMIRLAKAKQIPNSTFVIGDCFELAVCARPAGAVISRGVLLSHYGHEHALSLMRSARSV